MRQRMIVLAAMITVGIVRRKDISGRDMEITYLGETPTIQMKEHCDMWIQHAMRHCREKNNNAIGKISR